MWWLVPLVTMMLPVTVMVAAWHVTHVEMAHDAWWMPLVGGRPWHEPHPAPPCVVHTGCATLWHHAVAQVCAS